MSILVCLFHTQPSHMLFDFTFSNYKQNIIPAVASTNAIIAAACVNEAIKYLTYYSQSINTYMMYTGSDGIYSLTYVAERKDDCIVCSNTVQTITLSSKTETTLLQLIQQLKDQYKLTSPSVVSSNGQTLYMPKPPMLEQATRPNLSKVVSSLIDNTTEELTITDPLLESMSLTISIQYEE
jgi:NEDD8-activating enzyme E1